MERQEKSSPIKLVGFYQLGAQQTALSQKSQLTYLLNKNLIG